MKLKWFGVSFIVASALLALTFVAAHAVNEGWGSVDGVSDRMNISNSGDIRQPALTLGDNNIAVFWSGMGEPEIPESAKGVFQAVGTTMPLSTTPPLTLTGTEDTWAPNGVYAGDELRVAWVQGNYSDQQSPTGRLFQQDIGSGDGVQELMNPVYGHTAPRLLTGVTGDHLLIASAESQETFSQGDLYYMHRPAAADSWLAPTVAITRAQAANPYSGGIWYPHAALSDDAQTLHVVWEQTIRYGRSVWYVSGTWLAAEQTFDWGSPQRLSVSGKTAVRPKVALDAQGRVHVTWVEQDVVSLDPRITLQYINYRRLDNTGWDPTLNREAVRLDNQPVQVNTYRPTWSTISMATLNDTICVAWHGYRAAPGASGHEEIFLNCSKDGGQVWSDIVTNVSETPERLSLFPAMAIDDAGELHIAWEEHMGGGDFKINYDVHYRSGPLPEVKKVVYMPLIARGMQ
jgi:hypothetical protein